MANSGLLKKLDECVYPEDFLVARLHGRHGGLFHDWEFLLASERPTELLQDTVFYPYLRKFGAAGIWLSLHQEHIWIYKRMNNMLRNVFEPYFIHRETATLIKTVRYLHSIFDERTIAQQLENSLLDSNIQKILTSGEDFNTILHALEAHFASQSNCFEGLYDYYEKNGLRGLEIFLREKFINLILLQCKAPQLRTFFTYLIDFHNCMTLAKYIRWEITDKHVCLDGGTIGPEKFRQAYLRKQPEDVLKIFSIRGAVEEVTSFVQLENTLLSLITRVLRRWARQKTTVGEILYYLWEQYRYARNISMVINTARLKDGMAEEGLLI
jgi:hypothetical protein